MRHHKSVAILIAGGFIITGCAAGPGLPGYGESPIFDRSRTSADELPADVGDTVDPDSSRYGGEDSAGNQFWAAHEAGSRDECIVYAAGDASGTFVFCGGPGLTGSAGDGLIVEFVSSPKKLSPTDAELVGDTFLVQQPN